ncbi:MAG: METTL5 family protein [Candidatus Thorarchaeota archaeon]
MHLQTMERLDEYDHSSYKLESYPTPANIAATILYAAEVEHNDVNGKVVCDLGCGDGVFAHGAALLGARRVIGVDLHHKALKVARRNSSLLGTENKVDLVLGDVNSPTLRRAIDTVLSNPPFGVKKRGADLEFLGTAISIAKVVYSIHLAGPDGKNRAFLSSKIEELGGSVTQVETFQFPIKPIYERHQKQRHLINVDLYRIECENKWRM